MDRLLRQQGGISTFQMPTVWVAWLLPPLTWPQGLIYPAGEQWAPMGAAASTMKGMRNLCSGASSSSSVGTQRCRAPPKYVGHLLSSWGKHLDWS